MLDRNIKPIVHLVSWTKDPIKTVCAVQSNELGNKLYDLDIISEEEAELRLKDMLNTGIASSIESISLVFQIFNVPRSFTHQIVRTRVGASYRQESLRMAVRTEDDFNVVRHKEIDENEEAIKIYDEIAEQCFRAYEKLIKLGIKPEQARDVLPEGILTNISVTYTYNTLIKVAGMRLCHQAQSFWKEVFRQIKKEVAEKISPVLAEYLKPICYQTGFCEFGSAFDDKSCPYIKEGVFKLNPMKEKNRINIEISKKDKDLLDKRESDNNKIYGKNKTQE